MPWIGPFVKNQLTLYRHATGFKERFLDPVHRTDRGRLPDPVISFDQLNVKTLAAYALNHNSQGLLSVSFHIRTTPEAKSTSAREQGLHLFTSGRTHHRPDHPF